MKILTVCQRGNCRSVACAFILKDHRGQNDVLACGVETTSYETKQMLCNWADIILVCADNNVMMQLPPEFLYKTNLLLIGPDMWGNPMHGQLLEIVDQKLKEIGL